MKKKSIELGAVLTAFLNPFMGMINDGLVNFLNSMGGTSRVALGTAAAGCVILSLLKKNLDETER